MDESKKISMRDLYAEENKIEMEKKISETEKKEEKRIIKSPENYKINKSILWYKVCLVVGLIGLIDIATRSIVQQNYGLTDMGYVGICSLFLFKFIFGTKIAAALSILISNILGFSIIWLLGAYLLYKKSKVTESPTEKNQKKFKRAKIIILIVIGIILFVSLYAIVSFTRSSI